MSEMTREEAIKYLEKRKEKALMVMEKSKANTPTNNDVRKILTRKIEALDMAISALSTEGEYIKKEDAIEYLNDLFGEMCHVSLGNVLQSIDSLQTYSFPDSAGNKGHWGRRIVDNGFNADWVCSECGHREYTDFIHMNFCPNCGADMREPKGEKGKT